MEIKKRRWVFKPTKVRLILTLVLLIAFSFFSGQRTNLEGCVKQYYGLPAEVYNTDYTGSACAGTGEYSLNIFGIIINLILWYPVACLLAYVGGKLKYGI